jgi:hypothetical protein
MKTNKNIMVGILLAEKALIKFPGMWGVICLENSVVG